MKTKKIRIRQGFTIVELVIVIGVIGVLAAVLIPTFVNLNNKANQAADESLIKNLNTQLRIKEVDEGKNKTMTEALADALEAGYKVENLTPKAGKDIVWDQEKDEFAQKESVPTDGTAYKFWTIAKSAGDLTKGYSSYLYFTPTDPITVNTGFDVGEQKDVSVKYNKGDTPKDDVRIRTNGGSLEINADTDVVSHWAYVDNVDIKAIKGDSYHEYGTVRKKLQIAQGHIVVEEPGEVPTVEVTSSAGAISIDTNKDIAVSVGAGVTESDLDNVEIRASGSNTAVVVDEKISHENVKINGKTATEDEVVKIAKVSDAAELSAALGDKERFIMLTQPIASTQTVEIDYSMTLDGDGHTLTTTTGAKDVTSSKSITISSPNVDVSIVNLKTIESNDISYGRGIQIEEPGVKLLLKNVEVNSMHYGLNMYGGTPEIGSNNCEVKIVDSTINSWGALNIWSHNLKLVAENSTFDGYNDKTYNNAGWNGFGTIVLEGDTTRETTKHAENCQLTFNGCTITSASTTGNSQSPVLYNLYSKNNTVRFNGCSFSWSRPNLFSTNNGAGNKLFIDTKEVLIGIDAFTFNTDELVIAEGGVTATGKITVTLDGETKVFDLATVTGKGWKQDDVVVGTDYVFEDVEFGGVRYTFDFDIWSGYENGWTLYLSAEINQ